MLTLISGTYGRQYRRSTIMVLTLLTAAVAAASGLTVRAGEVFTPEHIAKIRTVSSAKISPDGRLIAYTLSVPRTPFDGDDGPAWSELHVVDQHGKARGFITGEVNVGAIRWAPNANGLDGGIAFLAKRGKDKHRSLYVIAVDGGEARRVLSHDTSISSYAFSPDGSSVAFLAKQEDPDKKRKKELKGKGFKAEIYEENLRPVQLWIGTPDDKEAESRLIELEGSVSSLHFSPTGDRLVVAIAPTPLIDDHYMKRTIHVIDVASGKSVVQFDNTGKLGQIAVSPDGKYLAMLSAADIHDPSAGRLMVVSTAGGKLRDLIPGYEGQVASIAWKDNETIMYLGDEGVWTTFNKIGVDGTGRTTIWPAGHRVLSALTISADGQSAATLSNSPRHPSEVFAMKHGDAAPKRLTDSNPWFADMRFAEQKVITYAARDGLKIEGLLIEPLDYQTGRRYPLILTVHGGPESHYHNGWITRYSGPGQMGAAEGFAVFYPNYRGSTGRGVAFSKADQGDYAGKEFDDLVDGVDHLIDMGLVDRNRVGVTGGSYGGYATAWCSTFYSDRFAAGVMFVGISDLISKGGTTDIQNEMTLVHARMHLWDDWDLFLKRSPIYHVEKAKTPLLILGGADDTRVHPSQSLELFRYIKTIGETPVRLVRYPGEGHGNRKAAARYDYSLRMMRWMKHYLISPGGDPPAHELTYGLEESNDESENGD